MMLALLIGPAALYVVVASWAVRTGGVRRLWALAGVAAVALVGVGAAVGAWYAVPSLPLLLLYVALLFGPMALVTALALTPRGVRAASYGTVVTVASAGALAGLVLGVFAAVYAFSFVPY